MKKLIISVVVYNGEAYLAECLQSIKNQTFQDFECVVFDNNSQDTSCELVKKIYPEARLSENKENFGFSKAHNSVIRQTQSEYILLVNQDASLAPDYCEKLISFLDTHSDVGSVTGKIWRVASLTHELKSSTLDTCGIVIKRNHYAGNINSLRFTKFAEKTQEIFGVAGTLPLYRRQALEDCALEISGRKEYFDEDFFMYKEDTDLAYRLRWQGWKAFFVSDAHGWHVGSSDPNLLNRKNAFINYLSYRNNFSLLIKNVSQKIFFKCFFRIIWFEWGKFVYTFFCEPQNLKVFFECKKMLSIMKLKRAAIMKKRKITDEEMYKLLL